MEGFTPNNEMAQIANLHTIFNVVTSLLLIPFGNYLAKFAEVVLKDKREDEDDISVHFLKNIKDITEEKIGVSAISMEGTKKEIWRMLGMAKQNVHDCFDIFIDGNEEATGEVDKREEYIDFLNKEISKYISRVITHERTEKGSLTFNSYYTITSNVERIGDHAVNISGYSEMIKAKGIKFSDISRTEVAEIQKTCDQLLDLLLNVNDDVIDWHGSIAAMEQKIDDMTKSYRNNTFDRMQKGSCSDEGSILYSEMLTDFERIGDHALNISDEIMKIRMSV